MGSATFFLFACLCCLAAGQKNTVIIDNPQMYVAEQYARATLTLNCTQEGFILDFTQFAEATGATLTLGETDDPNCQFTYGENDQVVRFPRSNFNNFETCGAVSITDAGRVTVTNTIKVIQQYSGPSNQQFNWITCAKYNLQCCFELVQPDSGVYDPPIPEIQLCNEDYHTLFTLWFVPQPGMLYWHQWVNQQNPLYGLVPHSCTGMGRNKRGQPFNIELIRGGCAVDDPRMHLSVRRLTDGKDEYQLSTRDEELYGGVEVVLMCTSMPCAKDTVPNTDTSSRCSSFWQDSKLKSCSAPNTPLSPAAFPLQISRKSTTKMTCKKALNLSGL